MAPNIANYLNFFMFAEEQDIFLSIKNERFEDLFLEWASDCPQWGTPRRSLINRVVQLKVERSQNTTDSAIEKLARWHWKDSVAQIEQCCPQGSYDDRMMVYNQLTALRDTVPLYFMIKTLLLAPFEENSAFFVDLFKRMQKLDELQIIKTILCQLSREKLVEVLYPHRLRAVIDAGNAALLKVMLSFASPTLALEWITERQKGTTFIEYAARRANRKVLEMLIEALPVSQRTLELSHIDMQTSETILHYSAMNENANTLEVIWSYLPEEMRGQYLHALDHHSQPPLMVAARHQNEEGFLFLFKQYSSSKRIKVLNHQSHDGIELIQLLKTGLSLSFFGELLKLCERAKLSLFLHTLMDIPIQALVENTDLFWERTFSAEERLIILSKMQKGHLLYPKLFEIVNQENEQLHESLSRYEEFMLSTRSNNSLVLDEERWKRIFPEEMEPVHYLRLKRNILRSAIIGASRHEVLFILKICNVAELKRILVWLKDVLARDDFLFFMHLLVQENYFKAFHSVLQLFEEKMRKKWTLACNTDGLNTFFFALRSGDKKMIQSIKELIPVEKREHIIVEQTLKMFGASLYEGKCSYLSDFVDSGIESIQVLMEDLSEEARMKILAVLNPDKETLFSCAVRKGLEKIVSFFLMCVGHNNRFMLLNQEYEEGLTVFCGAFPNEEVIEAIIPCLPEGSFYLLNEQYDGDTTIVKLAKKGNLKLAGLLKPLFGRDKMVLWMSEEACLYILLKDVDQETKLRFLLEHFTVDERMVISRLWHEIHDLYPLSDFEGTDSIVYEAFSKHCRPMKGSVKDIQSSPYCDRIIDLILVFSISERGDSIRGFFSLPSVLQVLKHRSIKMGMLERISYIDYGILLKNIEWLRILYSPQSPQRQLAIINYEDVKGNKLLHRACIFANPAVVRELMKDLEGWMIDLLFYQKNGNGQLPMHIAIEHRREDMVNALFDIVASSRNPLRIEKFIDTQGCNPLYGMLKNISLNPENIPLIKIFFDKLSIETLLALLEQPDFLKLRLSEYIVSSSDMNIVFLILHYLKQGKLSFLIKSNGQPCSLIEQIVLNPLIDEIDKFNIFYHYLDADQTLVLVNWLRMNESEYALTNERSEFCRCIEERISNDPYCLTAFYREYIVRWRETPAHSHFINVLLLCSYLYDKDLEDFDAIVMLLTPLEIKAGIEYIQEKEGSAPPLANYVFEPSFSGGNLIKIEHPRLPEGRSLVEELTGIKADFECIPHQKFRSREWRILLLHKFDEFCHYALRRTAFLGTPRDSDKEGLDRFYQNIEMFFYNINRLLKKMEGPVAEDFIVTLFQAFAACGTRIYNELWELYELAQCMCDEEFISLADLGRYVNYVLQLGRRELVKEGAHYISSEEILHSHVINYVVKLMGEEFVYDSSLSQEDNAYEPVPEQQVNDRQIVREEVLKKYTPSFIMKSVMDLINSRYTGDKRSLVIQWLFENVPLAEVEEEFSSQRIADMLQDIERYKAEILRAPLSVEERKARLCQALKERYGMDIPIGLSSAAMPQYIGNQDAVYLSMLKSDKYSSDELEKYKHDLRAGIVRVVESVEADGELRSEDEVEARCWQYLQERKGIARGAAVNFEQAILAGKRDAYMREAFDEEGGEFWIRERVLVRMLVKIDELRCL